MWVTCAEYKLLVSQKRAFTTLHGYTPLFVCADSGSISVSFVKSMAFSRSFAPSNPELTSSGQTWLLSDGKSSFGGPPVSVGAIFGQYSKVRTPPWILSQNIDRVMELSFGIHEMGLYKLRSNRLRRSCGRGKFHEMAWSFFIKSCWVL